MIDFEAELNILLSRESEGLSHFEIAEIASMDRELLTELNKKQTDFSLQIEEIYDLVKEQELLRKNAQDEKARADRLVQAAISLADLLEDFYAYAGRSGDEALQYQAKLLWESAGSILSGCSIIRFGEPGQTLDPRLHTVKAGVESALPRERVVELLRSGYAYQDLLIRKAAVVVSRGMEQGKQCEEEAQE
jgi:molecular chaperone GrpE (heat shock protein)